MMKHTGGLTLGLGLFFAVPAMTFGGGLPDSIGSALEETKSALEVLVKLERQLVAGKPLPANALVEVTEAPLGDARTRDERRSELRDEVAALQAQVDAKKLAATAPQQPATAGGAPSTGEPRAITPGLSENFLKALAIGQQGPIPVTGPTDPAVEPGTQPKPATATTTEKPKPAVSPEGKGYSANALRQAQACYRAARYTQGLELLEASQPSPTVSLWTARFLERLDRLDEAIILYTALETDDTASELHAAAKRDREFAEWRRDFEEKAGLESTGSNKTEKKSS